MFTTAPLLNFVRRGYHRLEKRTDFLGLKTTRIIRRKKDGLNLVGYFSSTFGVAEVGRFFARQLDAVTIPFSITNYTSAIHQQLAPAELNPFKLYFEAKPVYHKTIYFINAAEIPFTNPLYFKARYNAAVFFWEFDDYFDFPDAFSRLDEVIVFTDFIGKAVRKAAPENFKVTKLTFPFVKTWEINKTASAVREAFGISQSSYVFVFNFDFHSTYERKNPDAILKALDKAFTQEDDITVVLKTIHGEHKGPSYKKFQDRLRETILGAKVILVNESMERNDLMSLINASDAYISLHRSEGLGLGMMEAMSMGKPVIGTAFGGNLDFMNNQNSLLVDYALVPLHQDEPPYKKGWLWAEPDINQAAFYMRKLYNDRAFGELTGKKAQAYINENYSKEIFLEELGSWLQES